MSLTNTMSLVGHTGSVTSLEFANNTLYSGYEFSPIFRSA